MSIDRDDVTDAIRPGVTQLLARAAADDARADARLSAAVAQLAQADEWRVDDRTRAVVGNMASAMIATIEGDVRSFAARALVARGAPDLATAMANPDMGVEQMLVRAGLLGQRDLARELLARVVQDMVGESLPATAPNDSDRPSLVVRLATSPDGIVSTTAATLMSAEARRRAPHESAAPLRTDLPAELHHRLVWWVVAGIAAQMASVAPGALPTIDRVLTDAALRSLAAHDEGDRVEAAAMQLAAAIDANPAELPDLLGEALQDRRLPLFIALLAHAIGADYDQIRDVVLDPAADRLWVSLRALDLPRDVVARIGLAFCEADPRRQIDQFADQLDAIMAVTPDAARAVLAPLRRHPDFRAAARAIADRTTMTGSGA